MESPVFLVGAERSGTALLRLMLDGHPEIAWPADFDFALSWPRIPKGREWPERVDFWNALAESPQARLQRIVIRGHDDFPTLVRSLLDQLARRTRKPVFGVTVHRHFDRLLQLWPDARFVSLVRDGRDVARSLVEMGSAGNVWAAARVWREAEREWRALCDAVPAERRIELRFESLVRDPEVELTRLCAFLGVPYAREMLSYPARSRYAAPDARLAERWRGALSSRELAWLEREIGPQLRARDYPASCVAAAWIPAPRALALRAGDRLGRVRFRVRRTGARLWGRQPVARRFRLGALARLTTERVRAIDAASAK